MPRARRLIQHVLQLAYAVQTLLGDATHGLLLGLRSRAVLAAEILFLRKQLALYEERQVKPRHATNAIRCALVWLSSWFDWRPALRIVTPETFTRWHRQGFRLWWRRTSTPGRPPLPKDVQVLIRRMARDNPTWGQERIANELLLKLGLHVSPRTVRKYMPKHCVGGTGTRLQSQRWLTFLRNHAQGIVACDFCVAATATFRSKEVDQSVRHMGLHVIKTPVRTPLANAICERVIGTMRRECLDCMIPLNTRHLYSILKEWVTHYNEGRPHMSLGPGISQPISDVPVHRQAHRHRIAAAQRIVVRPVVSGLHHEYQLEKWAA